MHVRDSCLLSAHNEAIKHERWGRGGEGGGVREGASKYKSKTGKLSSRKDELRSGDQERESDAT